MSSKVKVVDSGMVGGNPSRVVSGDGWSWVESWDTESWVRDDTTSIPEVAFGAPVSDKVLSRMGISPEDVVADLSA